MECLEEMELHIRQNKTRLALGMTPEVYKYAMASGRGVGKSAFVAMVTQWFQDTHPGVTAIVAANSEEQLRGRTFAEFAKWHTLSWTREFFNLGSMNRMPTTEYSTELARQFGIDTQYYYVRGQLWSKDNPSAFAGAHSQVGMMLIMDEASGIPPPVWEESLGFFTDKSLYRFWLAFSNPRNNNGSFADCFSTNSGWKTRHLDARDVEGMDQEYLNGIIVRNGEDSDTARVHVRGMFPLQSENQFIGFSEVDDAMHRKAIMDDGEALIMGVDPGGGGDASVIRWRQGRNGRVYQSQESCEKDTTITIDWIAKWIDKTNPDAVIIDRGYGHTMIDVLRSRKYRIHDVNFAAPSPDDSLLNMRMFMWQRVKEWLPIGCLDSHDQLRVDLTAPLMLVSESTNKKFLESKKNMRARGVKSPDHGDALALTFAIKVARRDSPSRRQVSTERFAEGVDYAVFG